jgi:hypothetical protein
MELERASSPGGHFASVNAVCDGMGRGWRAGIVILPIVAPIEMPTKLNVLNCLIKAIFDPFRLA